MDEQDLRPADSGALDVHRSSLSGGVQHEAVEGDELHGLRHAALVQRRIVERIIELTSSSPPPGASGPPPGLAALATRASRGGSAMLILLAMVVLLMVVKPQL